MKPHRPRSLRVALAIAGSLLLATAVGHADRAGADFFTQRGEKALKEKKWAEAQEHFRKAVEEDAQHVPARAGLGEAFFGAGDRAAALDAWRRAVADAVALKPLPTAWGDALGRVKKRLAELDASGAALAQLIDKHVEKLVGLAERWATKDPEVAASALRDAVKLRPNHPKASAMFAKMGSPPAAWTCLFDGRSFTGWDRTDQDKMWEIVDGSMVGDLTTGTVTMSHARTFKGDFDFRVEAKIVERRTGGLPPVFVVAGAVQFNTRGTFVGVMPTEIIVREHDGAERDAVRTVFHTRYDELPTPFDPTEWTTYELQFRGAQFHLLVNGIEILTRERAPGREEGGAALLIQSIRVAVRKVEALQR